MLSPHLLHGNNDVSSLTEESELWREERSHNAVERELLTKDTLLRRNIPTPLCEFVCGVREVRINLSSPSLASPNNNSNNNGNNSVSRLRNSVLLSSSVSRVTTPTSLKNLHNQIKHNNILASTSPNSSSAAFHRLKYFSTRPSSAPLAIPLSGSVDEPDARHQEIAQFLFPNNNNSVFRNHNKNNSFANSDAASNNNNSNNNNLQQQLHSPNYEKRLLSGKFVRSALKNLIAQVALIHDGGCSHNNISLQSVCLVAGEYNNSNNNKNKKKSSVSFQNNNNNNGTTFLLTRFDYATEFVSGDVLVAKENKTNNNASSSSPQQFSNVSFSDEVNAQNQNSLLLLQNINLKRIHHANLAIAPNILALTATYHEQHHHHQADQVTEEIYHYNNSAIGSSNSNKSKGTNDTSASNATNAPKSAPVTSASTSTTSATAIAAAADKYSLGSAEKIYRLFQQRQQAELFNRAQGRRSLPLSIPSCGPVCDVQGLASITTVLFRHLLEAGDDVFLTSAEAAAQHKRRLKNNRQKSQQDGNNSSIEQQHSPNPNHNNGSHRFWSCDMDSCLKKYTTGNKEAYLENALTWLNENTFSLFAARQKQQNNTKNNISSMQPSSSSFYYDASFCAFRVIDEVIASPQLAAFRIESLAGKTTNNNNNTNNSNQEEKSIHAATVIAEQNTSSSPTAKRRRSIINSGNEQTNHHASSPKPSSSFDENGNNNKNSNNVIAKNNKYDDDDSDTNDLNNCTIATCGAAAVELRWLLSRVLCQLKLPLPGATELRVHPFFWSSRRTAQFIVACAQFFCEDGLIDETLKGFCQWPPVNSDNSNKINRRTSSVTTSSISDSNNCDNNSNINMNHVSSSSRNNNNNRKNEKNTNLTQQQLQHQHSVAEAKILQQQQREAQKERQRIILAVSNEINHPDGAAVKHAEKLRFQLSRKGSNNNNNNQQQSGSSPSSSDPFVGLGSGSSPSMMRAHPLYRELFGGKLLFDEDEDQDGSGEKDFGNKSTKNASMSNKMNVSLINISPIKREQSMMLKEMFGRSDSGAFNNSNNRKNLGEAGSSFSSFRHNNNNNQTSSSPSKKNRRDQDGDGRIDGDDEDEELPPQCLAKDLGCSSTIVWWGKGEFRADASSHKDNAAVWLRMLTDIVGSSQHPFSTINTQSGRIRNSRSDLLLFLAVLVARMLEGPSLRFGGKNVKICGGDPFEFVSIAVHSRFPGLQMILIELLSRRLSDATIFCQFVAEQENLIRRGIFAKDNVEGENNSRSKCLLPLFDATKDLWKVSSENDEGSFSEECAEMFKFWS